MTREFGTYQNKAVVILHKREVLPGLTIAEIAVLDPTKPFQMEVCDDDGPSYMITVHTTYANLNDIIDLHDEPDEPVYWESDSDSFAGFLAEMDELIDNGGYDAIAGLDRFEREMLDDRAEYQQRAETYTMGMGA